jgi:hypothetical protein
VRAEPQAKVSVTISKQGRIELSASSLCWMRCNLFSWRNTCSLNRMQLTSTARGTWAYTSVRHQSTGGCQNRDKLIRCSGKAFVDLAFRRSHLLVYIASSPYSTAFQLSCAYFHTSGCNPAESRRFEGGNAAT